jgi:hypothetical protein
MTRVVMTGRRIESSEIFIRVYPNIKLIRLCIQEKEAVMREGLIGNPIFTEKGKEPDPR